MIRMDSREFVTDMPNHPPRKKCVSGNCHHDALSNWPYCDDCDQEMKHTYPEIWACRIAQYRQES